MCQNCVAKQQDKLMVGLTREHLNTLLSVQRVENKNLASQLFTAMTKTLSPHLPVLATFTAMTEFVREKRFGVLRDHKLVRVPLSIIGIDRVRYRTPILTLLHEAILSFRMSEITVGGVQKALATDGLAVGYLCSCGLVMGSQESVSDFLTSETVVRLDYLRSAIDTEGNPVKEVLSWADIPSNMDLHVNGEDQALLERISDLTLAMAKTSHEPDYSWIEDELHYFVSEAGHEALTT
jgi:hypothetical protein